MANSKVAKEIDAHELENILSADTYSVYDCATQTQEEITDFKKACEIALVGNRKLVYAFNKAQEDGGALSRFILLDKRNIQLLK
jgi:hypothetical protein